MQGSRIGAGNDEPISGVQLSNPILCPDDRQGAEKISGIQFILAVMHLSLYTYQESGISLAANGTTVSESTAPSGSVTSTVTAGSRLP